MVRPIVQARRCPPETPDSRVRAILFEMLDGLDGLAPTISSKRRIAIKSNLGILDVRWHKSRAVALADAVVVEAVVAWLRAHSDANIVVGDASTGVACREVADAIGLTERLTPHHAQIVDYKDEPYTTFRVPGGGIMFDEYVMTEEMAKADAIVSIAKMKSHLAAGVTLTMKNLFGIPPTSVYGSPRRYLHAAIRLPRVLADLGLILRPCLNVIDGIVGQAKQEWHGPAVESGWLVAGDNTVATDAVGMALMGVRPDGDYPDSPFHFDRNPVKLASERGLGPLSLDEIDLRGDRLVVADGFFADRHMEPALLDAIRYSVSEQSALFRSERNRFVDEFANQFIGLYDGDIVYTGTDLDHLKSRGQLARERGRKDKGLYLKYVVPPERDSERFEVYDALLNGARA
jgi:uncharacterized protein (DUF362 family)